MREEKFGALTQLLGGYFHQDWPDEYSDDLEALQSILKGEPKKQIFAGLQEIDRLLSAGYSDGELRSIMVDQIGCYFEPSSQGVTYADWLRKVHGVFSGSG